MHCFSLITMNLDYENGEKFINASKNLNPILNFRLIPIPFSFPILIPWIHGVFHCGYLCMAIWISF